MTSKKITKLYHSIAESKVKEEFDDDRFEILRISSRRKMILIVLVNLENVGLISFTILKEIGKQRCNNVEEFWK